MPWMKSADLPVMSLGRVEEILNCFLRVLKSLILSFLFIFLLTFEFIVGRQMRSRLLSLFFIDKALLMIAPLRLVTELLFNSLLVWVFKGSGI